jgi:PAS domain S-box-containing protein
MTLKVSLDGIMSKGEKKAGAVEGIRDEKRFSSDIIDSMGALLLVLDAKGRIVRINRAFEKLTGYTLDEVLGKDIRGLQAPEEVDEIRDVFQNIPSGGWPSLHENLMLTKNGDSRLISWSNTAILGSDGSIQYIISTGTDITRQREAEMEREKRAREASNDLQRSEAKGRAILDAIPDLMFHIAADGTFLDYRAPCHLELYAPSEHFLGKKIEEVLPPDLTRQMTLHMEQARESSTVQAFEYKLTTGGHMADFEARIASCTVGGFLVLVRNITKRKEREIALAKSQCQISAIIDSTQDMIWSVDPVHFGLLTFNRGLKDYFSRGWRIDIKEGMTPHDLLPTEASARWWCDAYTRALNEGPFSMEYQTTAGTHILLLTFNILKQDDEVFGVSVFGKDITERKRSEEEMRKSNERYQAFIAQTSEGIYRLESDQPIPISLPEKDQVELILEHVYIAECNDACARIYGLNSADELIGMRLADYLRSFRLGRTEAIPAFIRSGYRLVDAETQGVDKNDNSQCIVDSLIGIVDNGFFLRAWGVQRDITERKKMVDALRDSEERFRAAIDNFPYSFAIYDKDLRIRYINRAGAEIRGLAEDMIRGHTNEEISPSVYTDACNSRLRAARETRTFQTFEYTYDLPQGTATYIINYVPLLDESDGIRQILGITYDITEIKEAGRKLERALDENKRQNRLLRTVAEELKGNYDEIEKLLYRISGDLMAPVTTIKGVLGLLKKDVEASNRLRIDIDIGLIGDTASRMQDLLNECLELSSLGRLARSASNVPFGDVVDDALRDLSDKVASSKAEIIIDEALPSVHIDRERIADVIISLIDSCIIYSGEGKKSRVHIGCRIEDGGPVFFVRSEGQKGDNEIEDAFSPCAHEEESEGTSLGLAITRRIIELHGGRMWTQHSQEGCAIYFTLPGAKGAEE